VTKGMDDEYQDNDWQSDVDAVTDQMEDQRELMESQQDQLDANYPVAKQESNLFNLFLKVLRMRDSTRVGNLTKGEIGDLNISVREAQKLGMLGYLFHHKKFGDFFYALAEITSSTSMSKDGWFSELFVSQKKFTQRARRISNLKKAKWSLFGKRQGMSEAAPQ
jgi:hypothetical protein